MKIRELLFFTIFALVISGFVIQETDASDVRGVTSDTIKIGLSTAMTGPGASLGVQFAQAIRTKIKYTNDNGGVNGRQLDLIIEDDRYSIPPAIAALKKLVYKDKIFAMIGPGSSSQVNVIWKKIQKDKLPTILLPMPEVAVTPFKRYLFTMTDTYPGQVKLIVDYLVKDFKLKQHRIAIVYPDTEAGKIDLEPALKRIKKYNLKPVTKEILSPAAMDASSQVMNFKRYKANCVLHVGTITPTTITLLRDIRKYGLKIPLFATWGAMLGEEMNAIGDQSKMFYSVHGTSPWYSKGRGMEKMRKITLKYHPGTEKPHRGTIYTHGWICTHMMIEGLKRAGKDLSEDSFISGLENLKNYDIGGLCGPISFSSTSHKGGNSWKIYRANSTTGKYVPLTGWRVPK